MFSVSDLAVGPDWISSSKNSCNGFNYCGSILYSCFWNKFARLNMIGISVLQCDDSSDDEVLIMKL